MGYAVEELTRTAAENAQTDAKNGAESVDENGELRYNSGEVKYAKKRHFAKQDISTITPASYIHHAWATNELTGCLTPSEISEFNRVIGEMKAGTFNPVPLSDGKYLLEVGKYVNGNRVTYILTDGAWQGQSIEWVGKIVTNNALFTKIIKEYVDELSETLGCEAVALAFDAYATDGIDEGFQEFTPESAVSYEEFARQRAESQGNTGDNKIQYSRKRNVDEIGSDGVKQSRKSIGDTVTISKGEMAKLHANYAGEKVLKQKRSAHPLRRIRPRR